jgi:hypothetical protein
MKFGSHFGSRAAAGTPDSLTTITAAAEALGYEHFGISDHVGLVPSKKTQIATE